MLILDVLRILLTANYSLYFCMHTVLQYCMHTYHISPHQQCQKERRN